MRSQDIFTLSFRIPDWRQQSDIVIVAPKVRHISKNILGYTCPLGYPAEGLGVDLAYKIHYNGYLEVYIYVNSHSLSLSSTKTRPTVLQCQALLSKRLYCRY